MKWIKNDNGAMDAHHYFIRDDQGNTYWGRFNADDCTWAAVEFPLEPGDPVQILPDEIITHIVDACPPS